MRCFSSNNEVPKWKDSWKACTSWWGKWYNPIWKLNQVVYSTSRDVHLFLLMYIFTF